MENTERVEQLAEGMAIVGLYEMPDFLRTLAEHIERRLTDQTNELAEAVFDFERGIKTLPELFDLAKEVAS